MRSLDEIINKSRDAREVKRALCMKMRLNEMATSQICELLNVSPQYVSKWSGKYRSGTEGAESLLSGHLGSQSYLSSEARTKVIEWIKEHETISLEAVRDYGEEQYKVLYQSKQSWYDLLETAGMSYHKSEKPNPQRDEKQVKARRAEIKKVAQHSEEIKSGKMVVLLEDECHLLWGDCLGYVWGSD